MTKRKRSPRRIPYSVELPDGVRRRAVCTVMRGRRDGDDMWNLLEHLGLDEVAREMLAERS